LGGLKNLHVFDLFGHWGDGRIGVAELKNLTESSSAMRADGRIGIGGG